MVSIINLRSKKTTNPEPFAMQSVKGKNNLNSQPKELIIWAKTFFKKSGINT